MERSGRGPAPKANSNRADREAREFGERERRVGKWELHRSRLAPTLEGKPSSDIFLLAGAAPIATMASPFDYEWTLAQQGAVRSERQTEGPRKITAPMTVSIVRGSLRRVQEVSCGSPSRVDELNNELRRRRRQVEQSVTAGQRFQAGDLLGAPPRWD